MHSDFQRFCGAARWVLDAQEYIRRNACKQLHTLAKIMDAATEYGVADAQESIAEHQETFVYIDGKMRTLCDSQLSSISWSDAWIGPELHMQSGQELWELEVEWFKKYLEFTWEPKPLNQDKEVRVYIQ